LFVVNWITPNYMNGHDLHDAPLEEFYANFPPPPLPKGTATCRSFDDPPAAEVFSALPAGSRIEIAGAHIYLYEPVPEWKKKPKNPNMFWDIDGEGDPFWNTYRDATASLPEGETFLARGCVTKSFSKLSEKYQEHSYEILPSLSLGFSVRPDGSYSTELPESCVPLGTAEFENRGIYVFGKK
jgi:hypothetical protein